MSGATSAGRRFHEPGVGSRTGLRMSGAPDDIQGFLAASRARMNRGYGDDADGGEESEELDDEEDDYDDDEDADRDYGAQTSRRRSRGASHQIHEEEYYDDEDQTGDYQGGSGGRRTASSGGGARRSSVASAAPKAKRMSAAEWRVQQNQARKSVGRSSAYGRSGSDTMEMQTSESGSRLVLTVTMTVHAV